MSPYITVHTSLAWALKKLNTEITFVTNAQLQSCLRIFEGYLDGPPENYNRTEAMALLRDLMHNRGLDKAHSQTDHSFLHEALGNCLDAVLKHRTLNNYIVCGNDSDADWGFK